MSKPVTLKSIADFEQDGEFAAADIVIRGLTADSREVVPGYLFAALSGTETDGARFVADAISRGAAAILIRTDKAAEIPKGIPVIADPEPRRRLALMAARFYGSQPNCTVAVTGTNGKTSVASFVRQIWQAQKLNAASLGTIGLVTKSVREPIPYTTPEPVFLHKMLARISQEGVTHLALETSSHGLAQHRVDGVRFAAAAFTNISRDHLDYHADFEDYFAQKLRLFSELLPDDAATIVDLDSEGASRVAEIARVRGHKLFSVGHAGENLKLLAREREGYRQNLTVRWKGSDYQIKLPLVGGFQASNALVAAGLSLVTGSDPDAVFQALGNLKGAAGRLDYAGKTISGAPIFIDYAHTPDALKNALEALRPYAAGHLDVVFGCGGDRDKGKRPQMGEIAAALADRVTVTDDNPRREDAATIRSEIMAAATGAVEIGDRSDAIAAAIGALGAGDLLLVAGKGHETGQIIGEKVIPYSDYNAVRDVLAREQSDG
ncbi:UDP-N-acetylmuramoyl-L-alanyl-D-glutamate--2, 6-diaminopimelate ligase [bacterium MnTg02]|nr:UDP-N-acetylmuramoyl-L-alanyl-D-glutamate--2, 6-diaminopimelate ligase [bacterium MnTg02]